MVISAIKTMTQKVKWSDRDVIIIDMPPGTGETQLTFVQEIKINGAIIVSTPQDLALLDVKRGIQMFDKTGVKILGLINNMSYFKGDDGKEYKIFGEQGNHARWAVGAPALPRNVPVEIEGIFEIEN